MQKKIILILILICLFFIPLFSIPYIRELGQYSDFDCLYETHQLTNFYTNTCYVYLQYYQYLMLHFFLSALPALILNSFLQILALIFIFKFEYKNDHYTNLWFICIVFSIIFNIIFQNTDLIILTGLVLYWRYRNYSFSPVFFILSAFKPIALLSIFALLILELFEPSSIFKRPKKLCIASLIAIFLLFDAYLSISNGYLLNLNYGNTSLPMFFIRPSHFAWLFYPIKKLLDQPKITPKLRRNILIVLFLYTVYSLILFAYLSLIRIEGLL